jgi:hypothetical protein
MKNVIFLFAIGTCLSAFTQTAIIAHKSHSGNAATFVIDPSTNFGAIEIQQPMITKINDTTIIIYDQYGGVDTVYNDPFFSKKNISIDSLNNSSFRYYHFINFDTLVPLENRDTAAKSMQTEPTQPTNSVKIKKKSPVKNHGELALTLIILSIMTIVLNRFVRMKPTTYSS